MVAYSLHDKLDVLGIAAGFLPHKSPFSLTLPSSFDLSVKDLKAKRGSMTITKTELLSSMEQQDILYDLYVNVTNRAIELYANSGRRKFALKLHGSLAALDMYVPSFLSDTRLLMLIRIEQPSRSPGERASDLHFSSCALFSTWLDVDGGLHAQPCAQHSRRRGEAEG